MRALFPFVLVPLFAFGFPVGSVGSTLVAHDSEFTARLNYVQGDVRVSLGAKGEPKIGKNWIDASAGMPIEQGFSVATEEGSTDIELENGSVIYLAPHSLLMFDILSAQHRDALDLEEFDTVRVKLLTGSAMFLSQFRKDGEFVIATQTSSFRTDGVALLRVTSYLNTTELVPLNLRLPQEWMPALPLPTLPQEWMPAFPRTELLPGTYLGGTTIVRAPGSEPQNAWGAQAEERYQERVSLTLAALRSTGLQAPFGGLVDLYKNGSFAPCGENETCWEPSQAALAELPTPAAQSPAGARQSQTSRPRQVVSEFDSWEEYACNPVWAHTTVWRDAKGKLHYDVQPKAGLPPVGSHLRGTAPWPYAACTTGESWYGTHRHRLLFKHQEQCHHHHHESPVQWVKVNGKVGFLRTLPNHEGSKPALDRKGGVYLLPQKSGKGITHYALNPASKLSVLNNPPRSFRGEGLENAPRMPQPAITAQFRDSRAGVSVPAGNLPRSTFREATFDYKAHGFAIPAEMKAGATAHPQIVAKMNAYGELYAPSGRNGNSLVSGLAPSGHFSGGGHGSSGGPGGSGSWGAGGYGHSSGGGASSSGSGTSHSSGGSGGSSASSGSSSASASGGGGGHSH